MDQHIRAHATLHLSTSRLTVAVSALLSGALARRTHGERSHDVAVALMMTTRVKGATEADLLRYAGMVLPEIPPTWLGTCRCRD